MSKIVAPGPCDTDTVSWSSGTTAMRSYMYSRDSSETATTNTPRPTRTQPSFFTVIPLPRPTLVSGL